MKITIPELSLVVLIGASGSGKSTFAGKHFKPTEVLSSDFCRAIVRDDEADQAATADAFDVLHYIAGKRLAAGRLTVIDATSVRPDSRKSLVALARQYHCIPVAIVLNVPEKVCHERNKARTDRDFGPQVIRNQMRDLRRSLRGLRREGFSHAYILDSCEEVETAEIERQPLWNNRKDEHGPFDIIGDVHGCFDELTTLLGKLGYEVKASDNGQATVTSPAGRKVIFLGDLVDRGPKIPQVLRLAMGMVEASTAICVPGNHDMKLMRKLIGKDVQVQHGLAESVAQLEAESSEFRQKVIDFVDSLVSHYVLDDGKLVVAHAGMKEEYQGRGSGRVREFALYGETTGETDEFGLPVRYNWAAEYRGPAMVVYGHTPDPQPDWLNRTINIDTGCVFGGALTALRYPEKELVSVPAARVYAEPARPLEAPPSVALTAQQQHDDVLDIGDVTGKRIITTRLVRSVTICEENAAAALEAMSRFAVNPKWLIYLPPTMSPSETSDRPDCLEHPDEAFEYFRRRGVDRVICEQKHMGSRVVVIVCRDEQAATRRFGAIGEGMGICYTRTGRPFFDDAAIQTALLEKVRSAITAAGLWEELATDWLCLDCELMPWSAKARELLRHQYAAVGAASQAGLAETLQALQEAARHRPPGQDDIQPLLAGVQKRHGMAERYIESYQRYCWSVNSPGDLQLAPFHLLASENAVHADKDHVWHMETLGRICSASASDAASGPCLLATPYKVVGLADPASVAAATQWWEDLTASGGEGMVVKPLDFVARSARGLVQPAIKCRGREYLRIIYGPEYSASQNLDRLRSRGLAGKRNLARSEFALGIEALERFVRGEPLRRVHECVFGVLALESEPVDPRL